jgi:hypothetical protein
MRRREFIATPPSISWWQTRDRSRRRPVFTGDYHPATLGHRGRRSSADRTRTFRHPDTRGRIREHQHWSGSTNYMPPMWDAGRWTILQQLLLAPDE